MSNDTPVTLAPPAGTDSPSVLHVGARAIFPSADGTFSVASRFIGPFLASGWRIVVPPGTTRVPA